METSTLVETFIHHGRYLRGWSPQTVRTYTQVLAKFRPKHVSKQSLHEYILSLRSRGLTPGGINVHIRTVNSFLTWLHEEGHTEERHRVRLLRAPKRVITLVSDDDVRQLIAFKPKGHAMRRAHALVLLLLDTGLRISEALTLERSRVDLERRCVTVMGKGSRERVVPISVEGRKALFSWLSRSKGRFVFCAGVKGRLSNRNAARDMEDICQRAGITHPIHPHALRHSFACNYMRSGGDVYRLSRVLGHSSLATTQLYLRSMGFEALQEGHRSPLSAGVQADGEVTPRSLRECEAEAVALLCCAALDLPGVEQCRGYIQHWWGAGNPIPERAAQRVLKVADQILKAGGRGA